MNPTTPHSHAEPSRSIPVTGAFEVLVAGGGLGGVAAALAAGRAGAKTLLIERSSCLGGVATSGLCCSIFNCFFTSEGVLGTAGIPVEVADKIAAMEGYGDLWRRHKAHVIYDVENMKRLLETLLADAGVEILYDTFVSGAVMNGKTLQGLVIENKGGRQAIRAKVVVDSTADADVAVFAGAPHRTVARGDASLCFRLGNVEVDAFADFFRQNPVQYPERMDVDWSTAEALAHYDATGTFLFPHGGGIQMEALKKAKASGDLPPTIGIQDTTDACQMHLLRRNQTAHVVTGFTHFNGLETDRISASYRDGRRMAAVLGDVYRKYIPGFSKAYVIQTADKLGVRVSRSIEGTMVLTQDQTKAGTRFDDVVARAVMYANIVKHSGKGAWGVHVMQPDSFDLPWRIFLPKEIDGLVMGAGRSLSVYHPGLLRVMVHTMVAGQAAGVGAATAVKTGTTPQTVPVAAIQKGASDQGAL
jgi:hypothetical protein